MIARECKYCGRVFENKIGVAWHINYCPAKAKGEKKYARVGRKSYLCHRCSKSLPTPSKLARHERSHPPVERIMRVGRWSDGVI